jgi:hypothetical protein
LLLAPSVRACKFASGLRAVIFVSPRVLRSTSCFAADPFASMSLDIRILRTAPTHVGNLGHSDFEITLRYCSHMISSPKDRDSRLKAASRSNLEIGEPLDGNRTVVLFSLHYRVQVEVVPIDCSKFTGFTETTRYPCYVRLVFIQILIIDFRLTTYVQL